MSEVMFSAIIALIGGVIGAVTTLAVASHRNKLEMPKILAESGLSRAQAADQIGDAAMALLKPYKDEVDSLRKEVRTLRDEIETLRSELSELVCERNVIISGAHQLYHQIISMGGAPVYRPPDRRDEVKT